MPRVWPGAGPRPWLVDACLMARPTSWVVGRGSWVVRRATCDVRRATNVRHVPSGEGRRPRGGGKNQAREGSARRLPVDGLPHLCPRPSASLAAQIP